MIAVYIIIITFFLPKCLQRISGRKPKRERSDDRNLLYTSYDTGYNVPFPDPGIFFRREIHPRSLLFVIRRNRGMSNARSGFHQPGKQDQRSQSKKPGDQRITKRRQCRLLLYLKFLCFPGKDQYSLAPAGMCGSTIRSCSFSSSFSLCSAESSIPQDSSPIIGRGGRLTIAISVLPISSSGS